MDGRPFALAAPGAKHVVGLLWDGAPNAELLAMAAAGVPFRDEAYGFRYLG